MSSKENTYAAFDKIIAIALRELNKPTLPKNTKNALEEIIALARYQFDIAIENDK